MSTTEKALDVIRDGRPFSFIDGSFTFVGIRLGYEVVVPYFRQTLYVIGTKIKGRWDDPAHAVPTALRRRSSGRVQFRS
jgi:hypothetical protein